MQTCSFSAQYFGKLREMTGGKKYIYFFSLLLELVFDGIVIKSNKAGHVLSLCGREERKHSLPPSLLYTVSNDHALHMF